MPHEALHSQLGTFDVEDEFLIHHLVTDQLLSLVGGLDHHFGELLVLDHSDAVVRLVLVEPFISDWFSRLCPCLLLRRCHDQRVLNKLRVSESSYFFWLKRPMGGQLLDSTCEYIDLDPQIVDCINPHLLSTNSSMTSATCRVPTVSYRN